MTEKRCESNRTRYRNVPMPSSNEARKRMELQGQRDTGPELKIRSLLHKRGLRFRVDVQILPKVRRRVDIAFISSRVAVFVDGCFWHGCPLHGSWPKANAHFWRDKINTNRKRDRDTNRILEQAGWKVIRIWEHENYEIASRRISNLVHKTGKVIKAQSKEI